ncbi:hypothetical protein SLEP1_g21018 [Rubroshorea leprosula]|uniref:Uncharacterized protein n=1 Tax=Rubroshorea leprosula TaxID=152421 RepID=A0AAV5JDT6_9ROSI|nr:hypothetical protein SLEP1_g21018 [Rubroshorea leprosula]
MLATCKTESLDQLGLQKIYTNFPTMKAIMNAVWGNGIHNTRLSEN